MRAVDPRHMTHGPLEIHAPAIAKVPLDTTNPLLNTLPQHKREETPTPFAFNLPPAAPVQSRRTFSWDPVHTAYGIPSHRPTPNQSPVTITQAHPYPQYGNPLSVSPLSHYQRLQLVPAENRFDTATTVNSRSSSDQGISAQAAYFGLNRVAIAAPSSLARGSPSSSSGTQAPLTASKSSSLFVTSPLARSVTSGNDSSPNKRKMRDEASCKPPVTGTETAKCFISSPKRKRAETNIGPNFLTKLYDVLADPAYQNILHWDKDGRQIIIQGAKALEARILPLVYKQNKFASFSRQLNIYGFMRKLSVKQGESSREANVTVWTHCELDRSSTIHQLMTYKRRVAPRNYNRKTSGKAPLPVLGKGARYEFIDKTTPDPIPVPLRSLLRPQVAASTPLPLNAPPVGTKIRKMSAGTLPMPFVKSGIMMYSSSPRSVPYHPFTPKSGASRCVVGREDGGNEPTLSRAPPGGFWQQLLGTASEQGNIENASAAFAFDPSAQAGDPASHGSADGLIGMPPCDPTPPPCVKNDTRYQSHPCHPVPLEVAGEYSTLPLPPFDRHDTSSVLASPRRLSAPQHGQQDESQARELPGIVGASIDSSRISIAALGSIGGMEKASLSPRSITPERSRKSCSSAGMKVDVQCKTRIDARSFDQSLAPSEAGTMSEVLSDAVLVEVEPLTWGSSRAGIAHDGAMSVKIEECDEPECW
ncbi:hypothetical protein NliqN6_2320 [Naganishia liquefaciens]|uniref:HSF-type DNA-binding domain-containing protein n=1 Tax=Naganishia liquefaciens TaxID=104408 RepID=A0A8H3TRP3_9TREE|nr:hypothetical protein NliqN6_2320 [Naganishia liquefaciens]